MSNSNLSNWMTSIDGSRLLTRLTIPGTHDSSTFLADPKLGLGYAKTQNLSFEQQFESGVRFLDIRCFVLFNNHLELCHGDLSLGKDLQFAIDACVNFLTNNPGECILMSVKEDSTNNGSVSFIDAFDAYYVANKTAFYNTNIYPVLRDVRGKIVLLNRFDMSNKALGLRLPFSYNTSFRNNVAGTSQIVCGEDLNEPKMVGDKKSAIQNNINLAFYDRNPDHLYISFTSAYMTLEYKPDSMSKLINPWLMDFISLLPNKSPVGILAIDFIDSIAVDKLVAFNTLGQNPYALKQCIGSSTSYFPSKNINSSPTYVGTNSIIASSNQAVFGFQLISLGNRIYPSLQFGNLNTRDRTWKTPDAASKDYFPQDGTSGIGEFYPKAFYVDSNIVSAPKGQVVIGVALYEKINPDDNKDRRVAIKLLCGTPSKNYSDQSWVTNENFSTLSGTFVQGYNLSNFYVEDSQLVCDVGQVVVGIGLMQGGLSWTYSNRISYQIVTASVTSFI